jgi:hypothetical protein
MFMYIGIFPIGKIEINKHHQVVFSWVNREQECKSRNLKECYYADWQKESRSREQALKCIDYRSTVGNEVSVPFVDSLGASTRRIHACPHLKPVVREAASHCKDRGRFLICPLWRNVTPRGEL